MPAFTMPAANVNYTANFEAIDYSVGLSVDPAGSGTTSGAGTYNVGDSVIIGATANTGYSFVNWTDDDNSNAVVSTNASYTFTMPAANVNYTANFEAIDYSVGLSVDPAGSGTTSGAGTYNVGDSVIIGATANTGYSFVNWTDDDNSNAVVSTNASYTFTMPAANVNYTANFEANTGCLLVKVYNPTGEGFGAGTVKLYNDSNTYGPYDTVANGWYTFTNIPVGTYTLEADRPGAHGWTRPSIEVIIVIGTECQEESLQYS